MAHTLGKDVFAAATFKVRETLLFREREREREKESKNVCSMLWFV